MTELVPHLRHFHLDHDDVLVRFLDAIERAPTLERDLGPHDVRMVSLAWEFCDADHPAHVYIVDLVDGRRIVLDVEQPEEGRDVVTIEPLAAGAMPARRPEDESLAPWYEAHHIAFHIAEPKLLPPALG